MAGIVTTWTSLHPGPPPTSASNGAMTATPDGVVLVTPWGWRGETHATWTLGEFGFENPQPLDLAKTYYGPMAWWDRTALAVATFARELRVLHAGETRVLPIATEDGPTSAIADGKRVVLVIGQASWVVEGSKARPLGPVEIGSMLAIGGGRIIATTAFKAAELVGDAWQPLGTPPEYVTSTPAWDPTLERFVVLAGRETTRLYSLEEKAWKCIGQPFPEALGHGALLAWDERRRALVVHGGSDARFSMQSTRTSTWLRDGDGWRELRSPFNRQPGRYDSMHRVGDRTLVVSHSHLTVETLTKDGFTPALAPPREREGPLEHHDDRHVFLAGSSQGLWQLDRAGHLWLESGSGWQQKTNEEKSPVEKRGSGALVADESGEALRLLLVGGYRRNDTWVFEGEKWRLLRGSGLPAGRAAVVATRVGVYALVGAELRRLVGDEWQLCFAIDDWKSFAFDPRTLHHDRGRDVLVAVTGAPLEVSDGCKVRVFSTDGARVVDSVPERIGLSIADSATVGLDADGDRLLVMMNNSIDAFDLANVGAARGLPAPLPAKTKRKAAKKKPPKGAFRPAVVLGPTMEKAPSRRVLKVPAAYVLYAWLPASKLLPLGPHASIAISVHNELFARDLEDPFSDAMRVQLLAIAPSAPVLFGRDGPVVVRDVAFDDPNPSLLEQLDTTEAWDLRNLTKIGGFAAGLHAVGEDHDAIQTFEPCRTCKKPMRFAVQLSYDYFDIGDSGRLFVYVCPNGCDAAASVESL